MANYRISEDARKDLRRIYRRGVLEFGEVQADRYFDAFFERFDELASQPHMYPAVDDIREGLGATGAFGALGCWNHPNKTFAMLSRTAVFGFVGPLVWWFSR